MGVLVFPTKKKKALPAHALDKGEEKNVIWVRKILYFKLFTTQGAPHNVCVYPIVIL